LIYILYIITITPMPCKIYVRGQLLDTFPFLKIFYKNICLSVSTIDIIITRIACVYAESEKGEINEVLTN